MIKPDLKYIKERKRIGVIYGLLILMICINGFLSAFVVSTLIRCIQLLSLIIIIYNEYKLWRMGSLQLPRGFSKFALICLFALIIGIIVRGEWNLTMHYFLLKLLSFSGFLPYLLPFLILPLPNSRHLDTIKKNFFVGAILSCPLWMINIGQLVQDDFHAEGVGSYMPFFAAFLLGFPFVTKSNRKICFGIWLFYLMLMVLNARRNMVFSLTCYGLIAYYCCNISKFAQRRLQGILLTVLAIVMALLFVAPNIDFISEHVFSRFSSRLGEDTRSGVENLFFLDFSRSPIEDWIWGRGLDGGYYQEMRDPITGELETNRLGIETGYLNNILKGGVLYASFMVIVMLVCLIRSIKIKNIYSVYLRLVFLMFFVDLYSTVLMGYFGVKSVLFWFCVSIAMSREYPYLGQAGLTVCQNENSKTQKSILYNNRSHIGRVSYRSC